MRVRLHGDGLAAGAVYVALGLAWALAGAPFVALAWITAVAIAGVFLPGWANQVSLARAYLAAPALVYALHHDYALLAVCVALAGLSDMVDGTIARRFATPSRVGGGLDPVVDGLFIGALVLGLVLGGTFPAWLALVVVARYLLPAVVGALLLALGRRPELRHTLTGQVSTTLILILVGGVCLLRGLNQDASGLLTGAEVVIPLATAATYAHLFFATFRRPAAASAAG